MANIRLNEFTYNNINTVKFQNADTEGTVSFSGGGVPKKVLYMSGNDMYSMFKEDYGNAFVSMFPKYISEFRYGDYSLFIRELPNFALSNEPATIYVWYYNNREPISSTSPLDQLTYEDKVGIIYIGYDCPYFVSYKDVTLRDTGETVQIGNYTFHEAVIVE